MNKIIIAFLTAVLAMSTGCAKLVDTEYKEVDVRIVDKYQRARYTTRVRAGKVTNRVIHPAIHRIYVEYKGVRYIINGRDVYTQYKNKIGQTAKGELKIDIYDDGTVKYDIVKLK